MSIWIVVTGFVLLLSPAIAPAQPRVDNHGFPLPPGALARLGDLHFAQPGTITAMALSPDGKIIASAGGGVFLWDAARGLIVRKIDIAEEIMSVAFSNDGRLLAGTGLEGEIFVWERATGKTRWKGRSGKKDWRGQVIPLRFIANDRLLAAGLSDIKSGENADWCKCQVQVWDVGTGKLQQSWDSDDDKKNLIQRVVSKDACLVDVALSPSGERMAWLAASESRDVKHCAVFVYETRTGKLLREVKDLRAPAEKIDLLDEGTKLLVKNGYSIFGEKRNAKGEIEFFSEGSHEFVDVLNRRGFRFDYWLARYIGRPLGERLYVSMLGVAPDGKSMFVQDEVGIRRIELATGKLIKQFRTDGRCRGMGFLPGGERILLAQGSRLLICDEGFKPIHPTVQHFEAPTLQFLTDGKLGSSSGAGRDRLNIWNVRKRKIAETAVRSPAPFSGRTPYSFDARERLFAYHLEKRVVVHDLIANRQLAQLEGVIVDSPWDVWPELSDDGKRVLVTSSESETTLVRWFETHTGRELGRRSFAAKEIPRRKVRNVLWYSEDGSTFGYIAADGRLTLRECGDKEKVLRFGIPEWVLSKKPSPESRWPLWDYEAAGFDHFIFARRDREKTVHDHEYALFVQKTGEMLRRFNLLSPKLLKLNPATIWVPPEAVSTDGRVMAVVRSANEILFFETATGRLRATFNAPNDVNSFSFSPDGKHFATSGNDTTILLWDLEAVLRGKSTLPPPRYSEEADKLWNALGDPAPAAMAPALEALRLSPEVALEMLKRKLRPVRGVAEEHIVAWIAQLGSEDFKVREAAGHALTEAAEFSVQPMYAALENRPTLEQSRRIEKSLIKLEALPAPPKHLGELRSLELLERIGTAEARALVAEMATGHVGAQVTIEARFVLGRWKNKD